MKLRMISESDKWRATSGEDEEIIELGLVGPKSKHSARKFGEYLLPHNLATVDFDLIDNPEYYERCLIYDLSNDRPGHPLLQELKPTFAKYKSEHGELVISYNWQHSDEEHASYWGGQAIDNAPKKKEFFSSADVNNALLVLYFGDAGKKELRIPEHYASILFDTLVSR